MTEPLAMSSPPLDGHEQLWSFYAIERRVGPKRFLVGVLPAPSRIMAITAMHALYPALFGPEPNGDLEARPVYCPGVANPMAEDGWIHHPAPGNVKCPRCLRSHQHAQEGHRVSVRLVGIPSSRRPAPAGHTRDRCRKCKAELEFVITALGDPPPRHPAFAPGR